MRIHRCVCADRTFASLLDEALDEGLELEQVCERAGAGQGCTMCQPYLRRAQATGQTVFYEILVDQLETEAG